MKEEREAQEKQDESVPKDTLMEGIRAKRRKRRRSNTKTLPIPGYEGELAISYKAVPRDELKKVYGRKKKDDIDLLIHLCESVMVGTGDGDYEPLEDEHGNPVRFDSNLAKFLDIEIKTERKARECVEGAFDLDLYPLSASRHAKTLVLWMEGEDSEDEARFLGE